MAEKAFDWTYFKRREYIKTSRETLFKKWATPKGITEFYIASATYQDTTGNFRKPDEIVQAGDQYTWIYHSGSKETGHVLEVKENQLFKFTFGEQEPGSKEQVVVTVTFHEDEGKAWVDVIQDNMANSKFGRVFYNISCNMGWMFHLSNLKSILEVGHDLRVTGENRMHVDAPSGYPLENYTWTEFQLTEYFNTSQDQLFKKWATSGGIIEWYLASTSYQDVAGNLRGPDELVQAGDTYKWGFYQGFTLTGKVLEVNPGSMLKFTFGDKFPGSEEKVVVTVAFLEDGTRTKLVLQQDNIADDERGHVNFNLSCTLGWSYYMMNLRSIIDSGFDLREKDQRLAFESRAVTLER